MIYLVNGWLDGAEESTRTGLDLLERSGRTLVLGASLDETQSIAYQNLGGIEIGRGALAELDLGFAAGRRHWELAMHYLREAVRLDPSNAKAQALLSQIADVY